MLKNFFGTEKNSKNTTNSSLGKKFFKKNRCLKQHLEKTEQLSLGTLLADCQKIDAMAS